MKYQLQPPTPIFNENGITTSAGWVLIYNTDPITGEYKNASYEYLPTGVSLPASAYLDCPLAIDDTRAVVRGKGDWIYPVDFRGETVYNINDGSQKIVDFIGELPTNYTEKAPASEFDSWNGEAWIEDKEKALQHRILLAKQEQENFLSEADTYIFELKEAIDLELATEDQIRLYKSWRQYRFIIKQIDINKPDLISWPQKPEVPSFVS